MAAISSPPPRTTGHPVWAGDWAEAVLDVWLFFVCLACDLLYFPMVQPAEVALLFAANTHAHTCRKWRGKLGLFGRHFCLHVYIDVIYVLMLTEQTAHSY